MEADGLGELETALREHLRAGESHAAMALAYRAYAREVLGYVAAVLRDTEQAYDVVGELFARMLEHAPRLRADSHVRAWMYQIARRLAVDLLRSPERRLVRRLLSEEASRVVAEVRESTAAFHKSGAKQALDDVRAALAPDEQTLLVLRVDRQLSWDDIALVFSTDDAPVTPAVVRKRFQRLKLRIREALAGGDDRAPKPR